MLGLESLAMLLVWSISILLKVGSTNLLNNNGIIDNTSLVQVNVHRETLLELGGPLFDGVQTFGNRGFDFMKIEVVGEQTLISKHLLVQAYTFSILNSF